MAPSPPNSDCHSQGATPIQSSGTRPALAASPDLRSQPDRHQDNAPEVPGRATYKPEIFSENQDSDADINESLQDSDGSHDVEATGRSSSTNQDSVESSDFSQTFDDQHNTSRNNENNESAESNSNTDNLPEHPGSVGATASATATERNASDTTEEPVTNDEEIAERHSSLSLFDRLLDSVMEGPRTRDAEPASEGAGTRPSSSSETDLGAASIASSGSAADISSAIVITVNYMFMDVANDPNPGRTGSLVVTLPNNAANREPRIISQFISLATRMAYSALVNTPKNKPGISVEKFETFKRLQPDDVASESCAICYESYDEPEDVVVTKRRKLSPEVHTPTETSSSDRSEPESASDQSADQEQKPYLCDHEEEYDHSALQLPCGHIFGRSCIAHWLKENSNCPLCRLSVGDPESNTSRTHAPISYIRFGSLGEDATIDDGESNPETDGFGDRVQGNPEPDSRRPGFLRRATSVIFNPSGRQDAPPPPLDAEARQEAAHNRSRNSGISPMINNISNFLRRSRRLRESHSTGAASLFTSGVASRRTPRGVHTTSSEEPSSGDFFESLRHLYGDSRRDRDDQEDRHEDPDAPETS